MSNIKVYSIDQLKDIFTEVKDKVNSLQMIEMVELKPFAECTPKDIADIARAYYNGLYTVDQIKKYWPLGATNTIQLSAMEAEYSNVAHAQQNVQLQIIDHEKDILTTPINGKTNAFVSIQLKNCLTEGSFIQNNWNTSDIRQWCNTTFINALPSSLANSIKPVNKVSRLEDGTSVTTSDSAWLISARELIGSHEQYSIESSGITIYKYYEDPGHRDKTTPGESANYCWVTRSTGNIWYIYLFRYGSLLWNSATGLPWGLAPGFCL